MLSVIMVKCCCEYVSLLRQKKKEDKQKSSNPEQALETGKTYIYVIIQRYILIFDSITLTIPIVLHQIRTSTFFLTCVSFLRLSSLFDSV